MIGERPSGPTAFEFLAFFIAARVSAGVKIMFGFLPHIAKSIPQSLFRLLVTSRCILLIEIIGNLTSREWLLTIEIYTLIVWLRWFITKVFNGVPKLFRRWLTTCKVFFSFECWWVGVKLMGWVVVLVVDVKCSMVQTRSWWMVRLVGRLG